MRKQWRGCKKSKTLVTLLFRSGGEFRKLLRNTPGLENELCSHPYVKNAPINIRDALYGGRTEASKTLQSRGWGTNPLCGCNQSVPLHL